MKTLTLDKLCESLIFGRAGCQAVTIVAATVPTMRKTGNPFYDRETKTFSILKRSRTNGLINWIYQNSVNNQRLREGLEPDFEPEPRQWGKRIRGTPFVVHDGKIYLELKVQKSLEHGYFSTDGKPIHESEIRPFLSEKAEGLRQGVDNPVILRDYRINNIEQITFGGQIYRIVGRSLNTIELANKLTEQYSPLVV